MEGLIPYVYRAFLQYRHGGGDWVINRSSSSSYYIRLPAGESSGRFHPSADVTLFDSPTFQAQVVVSTGAQSPTATRRSVNDGQPPLMQY